MKNLTLTIIILTLISCNHSNSGNTEKLKKDSVILKADTLIANNYLLTIEKADSFKRTDIFGDLNHRIKLTKNIDNSFDEAVIIQKYLSEKFGDYFHTTDTTLVLKLATGNIISFPFCDEKHETGYYFENYFKNIDYYLLKVMWDEGYCWMLVNRKNGYKIEIKGLPYISLDNQKIIAINSDLEAGYGFNGIELYSIMRDSLKLEFSRETAWGPKDLKWLSTNKLLLKKEFFHVDSITGVQNNIYEFKSVTLDKMNSR